MVARFISSPPAPVNATCRPVCERHALANPPAKYLLSCAKLMLADAVPAFDTPDTNRTELLVKKIFLRVRDSLVFRLPLNADIGCKYYIARPSVVLGSFLHSTGAMDITIKRIALVHIKNPSCPIAPPRRILSSSVRLAQPG